jgi:hypothetical protein
MGGDRLAPRKPCGKGCFPAAPRRRQIPEPRYLVPLFMGHITMIYCQDGKKIGPETDRQGQPLLQGGFAPNQKGKRRRI